MTIKQWRDFWASMFDPGGGNPQRFWYSILHQNLRFSVICLKPKPKIKTLFQTSKISTELEKKSTQNISVRLTTCQCWYQKNWKVSCKAKPKWRTYPISEQNGPKNIQCTLLETKIAQSPDKLLPPRVFDQWRETRCVIGRFSLIGCCFITKQLRQVW